MAKSGAVPSVSKSERDYQAEDDHRTMMRAAEVQADHRRMGGVKRHQSKQEKALTRMRTMMSGSSIRKGGR